MSWWQKGVCNSAPNGPNDLKFCMWGSFGRYIWFLFWSRSHDLYRGQTCSGLQMRLASIEVIWPWLKQKSNLPSKRSSHAKFQVNWYIGGWVTCPVPLLFRNIIEPYTEYSMISIFLSESCQSQSDVSVRFSDAWKWSLGWEDSVGGVSTRDSWHMFILDNNISIADMTPAIAAVGQLLIILGHICAVLYTEAVLYWCLS